LSSNIPRGPTGIPASLENAMKAVDALGAECRYDVFHDRIIVKGHECGVRGDAHENLENITLKVRQAVLERFGFDPSANFTFDTPSASYLLTRWSGLTQFTRLHF
jgi:hypothetical protein